MPKKEKGKLRLVVDYQGLNEQTEHDSYCLPLIDTILQKQTRKRIFTVLDLKHGYHQLPLHEDFRVRLGTGFSGIANNRYLFSMVV